MKLNDYLWETSSGALYGELKLDDLSAYPVSSVSGMFHIRLGSDTILWQGTRVYYCIDEGYLFAHCSEGCVPPQVEGCGNWELATAGYLSKLSRPMRIQA